MVVDIIYNYLFKFTIKLWAHIHILRENVKAGFLHSLDFLFLRDDRSLDYMNLIIFIQVLKSYIAIGQIVRR